jgi:hypothetical protein
MIDQDIKKFVLRALLARNGEPLSSREIKQHIRDAFSAAFTEGQLNSYIVQMQDADLIAGTPEELTGNVWVLTSKGTIRAQQLVKV